jgi:hypothetical protein
LPTASIDFRKIHGVPSADGASDKSDIRRLAMIQKLTLTCIFAASFALAPAAMAQAAGGQDSDTGNIERIAADFGDSFGTPEETKALIGDLRSGTIQGKREGTMGYGEIHISLALAQALAEATNATPGDALNEILAQRIDGKGWGEIAKAYDLNLGHIVARARSGNERLDAAFARAPARATRVERPEKPERPQRPERPERPERGGRS